MTDHLVDANKKGTLSDDDMIRMALKSGLAFDSEEYPDIWQPYMHIGKDEIKRFAALVAAHERETCAKTCESIASNPSSLWSEDGCWAHAAEACAAEIRGRS